KRSTPLVPIPGQVPPALHRPKGCIFASRCPHVEPARCTAHRIPMDYVGDSEMHRVQCVRTDELGPFSRPTVEVEAAVTNRETEPVLEIEQLRKVYHQSAGIFDRTGG